ncbi:MAG TPA: YbaB/EbfC family nucleoid-associated protein [Rugosimonospora sp.]|nr:YbaB/EbfC family nucleoid-associated protein [Rugosimonospora sp.]
MSYEDRLAEYREHVARLGETQRRLSEIACTATAPRQAVSVTVGHGGVVTAISFPTGMYKRMAPVELATALMNTINEARDMALDEAGEILAPSLPPGLSARAMLTGQVDLRSMLPDTPHMSDQTREVLAARDREWLG